MTNDLIYIVFLFRMPVLCVCAHARVYGQEMILSEQTLKVKEIICSHTWMNIAIYGSNLKGKSDKIHDLTFGNMPCYGDKIQCTSVINAIIMHYIYIICNFLHTCLACVGQSTYTISLRC